MLYAHYLDPNAPVEEIVSAMAEAVQEGKAKAIGLSNVTSEEIIQANEIYAISAVQYEYSLFRREAETDILPAVNSIGAALDIRLSAETLQQLDSVAPAGAFQGATLV